MKPIYSMPAVALDKETKAVIKRWPVGGDSHWILGASQTINGVSYKLVDIVQTAGVNYLICEKSHGAASDRADRGDGVRGRHGQPHERLDL